MPELTIPNPHPTVNEPPDGFVLEWYEEGDDWRLAGEEEAITRKCRGTTPACPGRVVAALNRRYWSRSGSSWWFYCEAHMYGRRIEGERILSCRWRPAPPEGASDACSS